MRVFNRLLVLVLGVALAVAGVLVVVEAIWAWAGSGPVGAFVGQWIATFRTTPWSAPIVIAISVAVAVVGLVLLLAELRPQRKRHAEFATASGDWVIAAPLDRSPPATALDRPGPRGRGQGAPGAAVTALAAQGQGPSRVVDETGPAELSAR